MITWRSVIGARFTAVCPFDYTSGLAMGRKFAICLGPKRIEACPICNICYFFRWGTRDYEKKRGFLVRSEAPAIDFCLVN